MSIDDLRFTSKNRSQVVVDFVDGSPCNTPTENSIVARKFYVDGTKKDYISSIPDPITASPYQERASEMFKGLEVLSATEIQEITRDDSLLKDVETVNVIVANTVNNRPDFRDEFPHLWERIEQGIYISPPEMYDVRNDFIFGDVQSYLRNNSSYDLMGLLNVYFDKGSVYGRTSADFCMMFHSMFYKVRAYFDQIRDADRFINGIADFISDLRNVSVKSLVEQVVNMVVGAIDQIVERYRRRLEAIYLAFNDMVDSVYAIQKKYSRMKNEAEAVLEEGPKVKSRITGNLANTLNSLEGTLQDIQFVVHRICTLLYTVETAFDRVVHPLTSLRSKRDSAVYALTASTQHNSSYAVAAGAKRFSPDELPLLQRRQREIIYEQGGAGADVLPIGDVEIDGIPSWNVIRSGGSGDPRIVLTSKLSGTYNPPNNMGRLAWDGCTPEAKVAIMRFQKIFSERMGRNIKLHINSAYRSPQYNKAIGGADRSYHMSGQAFDVAANGWNIRSDAELFRECARLAGFRGFGRYDSFIHIDVGPSRIFRW